MSQPQQSQFQWPSSSQLIRNGKPGKTCANSSQLIRNGKPGKTCANPIIEQWLIEWKEEAVQKNSKMQYVYSKALNSLRKYPLPLKSGKECKLLEYFGDTLCRMIDVRMSKESHLFPHDETQAEVLVDLVESPTKTKKKGGGKRKTNGSGNASQSSQDQDSNDEATSPKKGRKKTTKSYVPAYRSGAYAILVTLFKKEESSHYRGYMLRSELQHEAQEHCEASFTRPENPASKYTAWSSMGTLVNKGLVARQGTPVKYMLTVEGRELAAKLLSAHNKKDSQSADEDDNGSQSDAESQDEVMPFSRCVMNPGEFEIILCVDNCETTAKSKDEEVVGELRKNGINIEIMKMNVGDFAWICREIPKPDPRRHRLTISRGKDLVLPYIVERKRADDLASSIKDGRFHEQKLRLSQTGMKIIYLIEALAYAKSNYGLGDNVLSQAVVNTQIVNEFLVHETSTIKDTCAYLTHMTRHLTKIYQGKRVMSCAKEEWPTLKQSVSDTYLMRFSDFNEFAVKMKNWTVTEMFARHLMRLRGLSVDKSYAIIQKYPTPQALFRAYKECATEKEKELMLSHVYFGTAGRTVGPTVSRSIYQLYSSLNLN